MFCSPRTKVFISVEGAESVSPDLGCSDHCCASMILESANKREHVEWKKLSGHKCLVRRCITSLVYFMCEVGISYCYIVVSLRGMRSFGGSFKSLSGDAQ